MNEAAIILKRDAGGRMVVEQQRVDLVRAHERSVEMGSVCNCLTNRITAGPSEVP